MSRPIAALVTMLAAHAQAHARQCASALRISCALSSAVLACSSSATAAPSPSPKCSAAEYRQFDFWLGDWDAFDSGNRSKVIAHVQVQPVVDGCGLLEIYTDADGYEGRSFSIYDATRKVWHQTWITNRGQLLLIEGQFRFGVMELTGTDLASYGAHARLVRGTWQPVADGVREVGVRSLDDGKSWQPWFDLIFRRRGD